MTPTEQDKELRQKMQDIFNDCTSGWLITIKDFNGYERELGDMESEIIGDMLDLITADRKRVALEARIDEQTHTQADIDGNIEFWPDGVTVMSQLERLAELKSQQEEV